MSSKRAILLLFVLVIVPRSRGNVDFVAKLKSDASQLPKPKLIQNVHLLSQLRDDTDSMRNFAESSTFNPDVLNKFLEQYASKIKYTTEDNFKLHPYSEATETTPEMNANNYNFNSDDDNKGMKPTESYNSQMPDFNEASLNDTAQRNKYLSVNPQDDRNGWVALDAIPWSKSKISKWQSNPSTQNPWPDMNNWDTSNTIKPWYNRPKPGFPENSSRPPYNQENSNYAQKWPPEISPWDKNHRPNIEIITDNRPSNFPNNWDRNQVVKPNYPWNKYPSYGSNSNNNNNNYFDWNHPMKYEHLENVASNHPEYNKRPPFPQYHYEQSHSPSHPSNGDGQWILLSTNRGYSKTRQRSIKINASNSNGVNVTNTTDITDLKDQPVPVVSSRRQVRLTVLPSINGINTTVSHGGLLEVENTFKTVDQSQKEYELSKLTKLPTVIRNKPFKSTRIGKPSKTAVFAAVGAGMLPVTMAMMIPMMLGRRKRSVKDIPNLQYIHKVF